MHHECPWWIFLKWKVKLGISFYREPLISHCHSEEHFPLSYHKPERQLLKCFVASILKSMDFSFCVCTNSSKLSVTCMQVELPLQQQVYLLINFSELQFCSMSMVFMCYLHSLLWIIVKFLNKTVRDFIRKFLFYGI